MGNTTISKISLNGTVVTDCLNGFYTDVYTIKFYDDRHDTSPAIELNYQLVVGLASPLHSSLYSPSECNVSMSFISIFQSLTPSQCTCDGQSTNCIIMIIIIIFSNRTNKMQLIIHCNRRYSIIFFTVNYCVRSVATTVTFLLSLTILVHIVLLLCRHKSKISGQ